MTIVSTNIPPHTRGDLEKFIFFFNQIFFSLEWSNEAKIFVASKGHKNLQNESLERHDKVRLSLIKNSFHTLNLDKSTLTKSLHGYSGAFPDFHIVCHSALGAPKSPLHEQIKPVWNFIKSQKSIYWVKNVLFLW